jgi:DNA transposition AAA+ family ATPase
MLSTFIETSQYQRFAEVCDSCRRHRFIGVCYGAAGVGKTRSAERLTQWDQVEQQLRGQVGGGLKGEGKVAFYTPEATMSAKKLEQELLHVHAQMERLSSLTPPLMQLEGLPRGGYRMRAVSWELLVIDEAERLKPMGLEVVRDLYDRSQMGLLLIGMSGIEKRLARYPQFFSRVGFAHEFCRLAPEELREILQQQVRLVDGPGEEDLPATEALDEEALGAIIRMTGGNFRQIHRLLTQIERILRINRLSKVTRAVVEAARSTLLFGREE